MITESIVTVRYAETDKMGIVHHSNYPIWYELARTEHIKSFGLSYSQMEAGGIMTPLLEMGSKFIRSCTYEDVLHIFTRTTLLTPTKIKFEYEIFKEGDQKPINTGYTLHVFTDSAIKPLNAKKKAPQLYEMIQSNLELPL